MLSFSVPIVSENAEEGKESEDENQSLENDETSLTDDQDVENYFPRNFHNNYQQYEEPDDVATAQRLDNLNDFTG